MHAAAFLAAMKTACQLVIAGVLGLGILPAALAAPACKATLTVVVSERVRSRVTETHSREMLCVLASQLDIPAEITSIVLLEISSDDAMTQDIDRGAAIHEEHLPGRAGSVYFVWLVGDLDDNKLAVLLASALTDAAGRHPPTADFRAVVRHAVAAVGAKIDKDSLLRRPH